MFLRQNIIFVAKTNKLFKGKFPFIVTQLKKSSAQKTVVKFVIKERFINNIQLSN